MRSFPHRYVVLLLLPLLLAGCAGAPSSNPGHAQNGVIQHRPAARPAVRHRPHRHRHHHHHRSRARPQHARAHAGTALAGLAALPVKGRASMTGYTRSAFGEAWTDDNAEPEGHNGCDTRNDVLRRDLTAIRLKPGSNGCSVASGVLQDPYTGHTIHFVRGIGTSEAVQIDHVVALGDAWQTGAQQWTERRRRDLANDPLELLAVDGPANEAKGDGDAATWLPPQHAFRCRYVARQVAIKRRWSLWVTPAEHDAIARVLSRCPRPAAAVGARRPRAAEAGTPASPRPAPPPCPASPRQPPRRPPGRLLQRTRCARRHRQGYADEVRPGQRRTRPLDQRRVRVTPR